MYTSQRFPTHLQYAAALPCKSRKSKNVTLTAPQQTVYMFLGTTFNSSQTDCLMTFAKVIIKHQVAYFLGTQCSQNTGVNNETATYEHNSRPGSIVTDLFHDRCAWANMVQCDKLLSLGHASVEWIMVCQLTPDTVERQKTKVGHEINQVGWIWKTK